MKKTRKLKAMFASIIFSLTLAMAGPPSARAVDICGLGVAAPPFLSGGVDPNLLLMFDNSASMLDLAYVGGGDTCYDDTYSGSAVYAGYFDPDVWYAYDFADERFEVKTDPEASTICSSSAFTAAGEVCIDGNVSGGELSSVTAFAARGNFLNWAAASKLDVQKEILTGGKYDSTDGLLTMESRGCGGRRFVKKVRVTDSGASAYYLSLGIRPPKEEAFDAWENGTAYSTGDIVDDTGELFKAASSGIASGTNTADDAGVSWAVYTGTRWTNGATYSAGAMVTDPSKSTTIDKGQLYITAAGGTASGTGVDDDTGITDWVPYSTTRIEIFKVNADGFDNDDCQLAVTELGKASPNQGQLKQYIDDCMGYSPGGGGSDAANSHAAFNHAIHNCWYNAKHGIWPPGAGAVNSQKNACETIYTSGIDPWAITTDDRGYGCYGFWAAGIIDIGYVGRCWKPGSGAVLTCTGGRWTSGSKAGQCKRWSWVGGTAGGWDAAGYADVDTCVEAGMRDYCGTLSIPEVVDPSDQVGSDTGETAEFWNIPAVLVDSGVVAQLNEPLAVMKGEIQVAAAPEGLIQEFDDDIRIGAMVFNAEGSFSECLESDPFVLYDCGGAGNKDGGIVISEIDQSDAHTTALVAAINAIKATSWTPLSEAFYNAIGYYTQNTDRRLNSGDWPETDPVQEWCQNNNVLIITEGGSTADQASAVEAFAVGSSADRAGQNDGDVRDAAADCGALSGSTLLDDLTHYAKESASLHTAPLDGEDKQNITTHIVVAGTPRSTGAGECSPDVLLGAAADNGGTTLVTASNAAELDDALRAAFAAIREGASAGSAASVISSSRSGEGAAYQAIFWPTKEGAGETTVEWSGEVHALLVDAYGKLFEDTNHNGALDSGDERVIFYFDEELTRACNADSLKDDGTCPVTPKELDQVHFLWSASEWLAGITPTEADASEDILVNRVPVGVSSGYVSNVKKRYIFTWNDLDNDGIVGSGEVMDLDPTVDWAAKTVPPTANRGPVPLDFGVQTSGEVNEIIKWVRGLDQPGQRNRQLDYDFLPGDADPGETVTWRLGDIVHSTPMTVSAPAEGFHFLYRDMTYANFVSHYKKRRHMIYFGGNDGMLHALNGGFYDEGANRFCRTAACAGEDDPDAAVAAAAVSATPDLGAEMWAYVPYNLLPHLKCLTEEGYVHKYFVDQRPRIFDVRIFTPDATHIDGWGTILVGAMRLGGAKVQPGALDLDVSGTPDYPADNREFTSAYFILDITDPEKPPTLLGEFTRTDDATLVDLGYTLAIPTLVTMKDGPDATDHHWYLVLGSGPTDVDGTSNQTAKLSVMPLDWLTGATSGTKRAFRIPVAAPTAGSFEGGSFTLDADSHISDLISVDFELTADFKADVVYFGTVSGEWGDGGAGFGGKLHRLVTRSVSSGTQLATVPSEWSTLISPISNPSLLIDVGQPITASPSAGTDGENVWIYFGTGRYLNEKDRSDSSSNARQSFYGIKEPMTFATVSGECTGTFSWEPVEKGATAPGTTPGDRGLLNVTDIKVGSAELAGGATLLCDGDPTGACLPSGVTTFEGLGNHIVGTGDPCAPAVGDSTGTDGWYRNFSSRPRERNVGQATLLSGLLNFTTYQPFDQACLSEGLGFIYGLHYQTGTAYYKPTFEEGLDEDDAVIEVMSLGRGLATTPNLHVGKADGAKAFIQTSTGAIVEIPQPQLPISNVKSGRVSWGVQR